MKIQKLFQKTRFGIFALFGLIVLSTSILCIYTVDTQLSAEYETNTRISPRPLPTPAWTSS